MTSLWPGDRSPFEDAFNPSASPDEELITVRFIAPDGSVAGEKTHRVPLRPGRPPQGHQTINVRMKIRHPDQA